MADLTRLQRDLVERILQLMRDDGISPRRKNSRPENRSWLNEYSLAKRLDVSRTPVRVALTELARRDIISIDSDRGIEILKGPPADAPAVDDAFDKALVSIARDREEKRIGQEFSELELIRLYELSRPDLQRVLAHLSDLEMIERKPGYGWRFIHPPRDPSAGSERYRFRLLIEPMGILEPKFHVEPKWLEDMKARHVAALAEPWGDHSIVSFFEMNTEFHEGLAAASGNRFIHSSMRRQNQLRRLSNYNWEFGYERVVINVKEHLQMIDYLAEGEKELASAFVEKRSQ
jgi:DNA-binding GntR family transcriptional regulator